MLNRVIALVVVGLISGLFMASAVRATSFSDVPSDHWAYDAIDYLEQEGLVEGYPDGTFRGDRTLTRYEFAMVIARMYEKFLGLLDEGEQPGIDTEAILQMLMEEFQPELDELRDLINANTTRIDTLEGTVGGFDGRISEVEKLVNDMNTRFHPFGDIRLRTEGTFPECGLERKRARFRLRFGFTSQITDELVFGARLASGEVGGVQSTNRSMEDAFGFDTITIDQAYMQYSPMSWPGFTAWGGKFSPPWTTTPNVWDPDAMVEGLAQHYTDGNFHLYLGEMVPAQEGFYLLAQVGYDNLFLEGLDVRATYHFMTSACWNYIGAITNIYSPNPYEANPYRAFEGYAIYSNAMGETPWSIEGDFVHRVFEAPGDAPPYNLAAWAQLKIGAEPSEPSDWQFRGEWGRVHGNAVMSWLSDLDRGAGDANWWGAGLTYRLIRNTDLCITYLSVDRISIDDAGWDNIQIDINTKFK
ncbi:MAG: putative porin [bacterium]|nr:putative porin [bacterium]